LGEHSYRSGLAISVLLLSSALLPACRGSGTGATSSGATAVSQPTSTSAPLAKASNPGGPGPYPVGVTQITFQRPSTTTGEPRVLKTVVWYPAVAGAANESPDATYKGVMDAKLASDGGPFPIIMFSHGSDGTPLQSTFYTSHLASQGFVVVAPPHPGNTIGDCFPCVDVKALTDSLLNRPDDITFVLDSMLKLNDDPSSPFHGALDGARVGMSGHSFGGLTTLQLAGRDTTPFAAALAMAPPAAAVVGKRNPSNIPIMIMGGGEDTTCPLGPQEAYFNALNGSEPRFLVVFPRGGHTAYTDPCVPLVDTCGPAAIDQNKAHELIDFYATAFFKTYVAGEKSYAAYLAPKLATGDADLQYEAHLPN
jgi:predicted dienelactone hydrolase